MKNRTAFFRFTSAATIVLAGALSLFAQKEYPINAVQGDKGASTLDGQVVRVSGVVTAILKSG